MVRVWEVGRVGRVRVGWVLGYGEGGCEEGGSAMYFF